MYFIGTFYKKLKSKKQAPYSGMYKVGFLRIYITTSM